MKSTLQEKPTLEQLRDYFKTPGGPRMTPLIGVEYERLALRRESGEAIPFEGPRSVQSVLKALASDYGWHPEMAGSYIMLLKREDAVISLEPGGQIELSTPPRESIDAACDYESKYLDELKAIGDRQGILWSGLGLQPISPLEAIPWVPKERYLIMREFFRKKGPLAHAMMKKTASIQVTMDYHDEDIGEKFQAAMRLAPVITAMFANSCFSDGKLTGFKSFRSHVWQNTDPDRTGLFPQAFRDDFTLMDYVHYALDVPLFFIQRKGKLHGDIRMTFREYLHRGWEGEYPTLDDWALHLTCVFPEARIRQWLEIRSADRQSGILAAAVPAFLKAILYNPPSRRAVLKLLNRNYKEARLAMASAARDGLDGSYGPARIGDLSRECLEIAIEGMRALSAKGYFSRAGEEALQALREGIVDEGMTPADRLIREYQSGRDLISVVRDTAL